VNGCSTWELMQALESARAAGHSDFVVVSHNFEMLKPGRCVPDPVVVGRFDGLCRYLASHRDLYDVRTFSGQVISGEASLPCARPEVGMVATSRRLIEQAWRRLK